MVIYKQQKSEKRVQVKGEKRARKEKRVLVRLGEERKEK